MVCHVSFSCMFSKFNTGNRLHFLLNEAVRLNNTTETRLKNSELLYIGMPFTQHHPSKLMPSVRACLVLGAKNKASIIQLLEVSNLKKVILVKETFQGVKKYNKQLG